MGNTTENVFFLASLLYFTDWNRDFTTADKENSLEPAGIDLFKAVIEVSEQFVKSAQI